MTDTSFTFRADDDLKAQFTGAAKAKDRSGAQLLREFMREYVRRQEEPSAHDVWFRQQVQAGIAAANAGRCNPG